MTCEDLNYAFNLVSSGIRMVSWWENGWLAGWRRAKALVHVVSSSRGSVVRAALQPSRILLAIDPAKVVLEEVC